MVHKRFFFLLICLIFQRFLLAQNPPPTFLIKEDDSKRLNKMSRNSLKESIGKQAKKSLDATVKLTRSMGGVQMKISSLQRTMLLENEKSDVPETMLDVLKVATTMQHSVGSLQIKSSDLQHVLSCTLSCLIDNRAAFKHAGKEELKKSLLTMEETARIVKQQAVACNTLHQSIDPKAIEKSLVKNVIQKAHTICSEAIKSLKTVQTSVKDDECLKKV